MISGLTLALSFPPLHPLVLPFVGLVPFGVWICDLSPGRDGRMAARRGGLLFGTVYFGALLYWVLTALVWFTNLAIVAFLAALGLVAVLASVFAWLLHRSVHVVRVPIWVALPFTWTGLEWTLAHLPSTLAFPWLGLGTSLTGFPELVGFAEVVGARGVGLWIAMVNGLVVWLLLALRERTPWQGRTLAVVLTLLVPMTWGVWRARTLEVVPLGRVALVQPNIAEHHEFDTDEGRDSTLAALGRLVPRIVPGSVDLTILPEMTLPIAPQLDAFGGEVARLQSYSREVGGPLLFGGYGVDPVGVDGFSVYNSAFVMRPQGLTDFRYDKRFLVPFVERVPFVSAPLFGSSMYLGVYEPGQGWPLASIAEGAFGVLICYESSYPEASRAYRLEGADLLVNITNDAWYGREPWYSRTTALWQHPAHMVMRAIENRVGVARAANTGISMFVDPLGHVYEATPLFEEDVRVAEVFTTDVVTVYTRFGDVAGSTAAAVCLLLLLSALADRVRGRSLDPRTSHA